jgi:hypothetical protein
VKLRVLPFRVKIQVLALIGCAWQWQCSCWRHCFESKNYPQGKNLRSLIGRQWRLCTVPFWRCRFWRAWSLGVVLVVDVLLLLGLEYRSESSIFLFFFIFLVICTRTAISVLRCCRGWMLLVSHNINIFTLSDFFFENWLNKIDKMTKVQIRVGMCALVWAI